LLVCQMPHEEGFKFCLDTRNNWDLPLDQACLERLIVRSLAGLRYYYYYRGMVLCWLLVESGQRASRQSTNVQQRNHTHCYLLRERERYRQRQYVRRRRHSSCEITATQYCIRIITFVIPPFCTCVGTRSSRLTLPPPHP
jgi:hypothetical protein